jgi:alkanesulfonate monooxygenase SsuD/methylene tetrahydromethanopterin reductase-like flavin-dependent oxidoreductase (luciferase family)
MVAVRPEMVQKAGIAVMPETSPLHLAVALDGAGWHPAAWRAPDARPDELFTAAYWLDLVRDAERGLLDFVTIEDSLGLQSTLFHRPDDRTDQVRGRLDAVLIAARVAPLTTRIGLVPTGIVTHTEPFHLAKAIATLDYVSTGRAGWRIQVADRPDDAAHFGRRDTLTDLSDEAADYAEVVRRLWDSWEDDAEIRDAATGRFIDRNRLHYIDFAGRWFSVRGPSITPRPPQGQPVIAAPFGLATGAADVVFVTPADADHIRAARAETTHVFGDLVVFLDETRTDRLARWDELAGEPYTSDAPIFTGTAAQLVDLLLAWQDAGLSGFRLRPGGLPHDLTAIVEHVVPELQRRGRFRRDYEADTLRGLLGLPRPANRYAVA